MFDIEMFPAAYGDALWIEYGDPDDPKRILIDGGKVSCANLIAERIQAVAQASKSGVCHFELVILSHIDGDHIEGMLKLMANRDQLSVKIDDIWFNGAPHLPGPNTAEPTPPGEVEVSFGAMQGEMLGAVLMDRSLPWNRWADGGAIFIPTTGPLPSLELPGGMKLTLLGPTFERLRKLRKKWDQEVGKWQSSQGVETLTTEELLEALADRAEGMDLSFARGEVMNVEQLIAKKQRKDTSEANGSSIAVLAEYDGRRALLLGDAFWDDTKAAIERLLEERADGGEAEAKLAVDVVKMAHHGSRNNVSEELLSVLDADKFMFSTNGDLFGHPDMEAVARVIGGAGRRDPAARSERPVHLFFNYLSAETLMWKGKDADGQLLSEKWSFVPHYPEKENDGHLEVSLGEEQGG